MTGQKSFAIDPKAVLCRWTEDHDGLKFFYVLHVRDGALVNSYSNYADPLESNTNPAASASSLETSIASPLRSTFSPWHTLSGEALARRIIRLRIAQKIYIIGKLSSLR